VRREEKRRDGSVSFFLSFAPWLLSLLSFLSFSPLLFSSQPLLKSFFLSVALAPSWWPPPLAQCYRELAVACAASVAFCSFLFLRALCYATLYFTSLHVTLFICSLLGPSPSRRRRGGPLQAAAAQTGRDHLLLLLLFLLRGEQVQHRSRLQLNGKRDRGNTSSREDGKRCRILKNSSETLQSQFYAFRMRPGPAPIARRPGRIVFSWSVGKKTGGRHATSGVATSTNILF
jgi:hypothetical protein